MRRRDFLSGLGGLSAAAGLGRLFGGRPARADEPTPASMPADETIPSLKDIPRRKLGRIGIEVPPLSFGTAAMGHALYSPEEFEPVVEAAIQAGVIYLDTAPTYNVAQERLAPILARHRKNVFLVSKSHEPTRDGTLKLIEQNLQTMKTDHLDLCHIHNAGNFTTTQAIGKGGMLEGIQTAKDRGLVRFIGASGHLRPDRFVPVLETGQIDLVMVAMNFVDRYIYNFEERVLPTARKHGMAIVGMKVMAGSSGGWSGYRKKMPGRLVGADHRTAFRYALEIPDLATLVVGIKSLYELREAIQAVREHRPFTPDEQAMLSERGRKLAAEWGEHFGPVSG
jgi:predicted aldo/keto reductase-like oxidoreductase